MAARARSFTAGTGIPIIPHLAPSNNKQRTRVNSRIFVIYGNDPSSDHPCYNGYQNPHLHTHILSVDEGGPRTPTEKVKLTVR